MEIIDEIKERFAIEETKQDKEFFLDELSKEIKYLYQELEEPEEESIDLSGFTGTEHHYRDFLGLLVTDGVKHFQEKYKANWFVSDAAVILISKLKRSFVTIKLKVINNQATVTYEDGNGLTLFIQEYRYTDLPNSELTFFYSDGVMMLNSEY